MRNDPATGPWGDLIIRDRLHLEKVYSQNPQRFEAIRQRVRQDIEQGNRPWPYENLILFPSSLPNDTKIELLNLIAVVCERMGGVEGRSSQGVPFALLVQHALRANLAMDSKVMAGDATYQHNGLKFSFCHAWVQTFEGEIIDGNVDVLADNPSAPDGLHVPAYWGPLSTLPGDRVLTPVCEIAKEDWPVVLGEQGLKAHLEQFVVLVQSLPADSPLKRPPQR